MRIIAYIGLVCALLALVVGVVSRVTMTPINLLPGGLEAESFLAFTNTCLLVAVVFLLLERKK